MNTSKLELKFLGYEVKKISIDKSDEITNINKSMGFLFKIVPETKENFKKVNIIEGVLIEPSENFKYKLEVIIHGNFTISNCSNDKEKLSFLLSNASAILYPYLRSLVSMLTSQIECNEVILPITNFYNLFEEIDYKDIILDSKHFNNFEE